MEPEHQNITIKTVNLKLVQAIPFAAIACMVLLVPFVFFVPGFPGNMLRYIHLPAEYAPVAVAIYYYARLRGSFMKWFLWYHLLVLLAEIWFQFLPVDSNGMISHGNALVTIIASVFYGYVFYHFSTGEIRKKRIMIISATAVVGETIAYSLYLFGLIINPLYLNWMACGFVVCLVALLYLYENISSDEVDFFSASGFWLASGVCLFYSGISVVAMSGKWVAANGYSLFGVPLYNMVPRLLCVVLYGCTCMSIVCYARMGQQYR